MRMSFKSLPLFCSLAACFALVLPAKALTVTSVGSVVKGSNGPTEVVLQFSEPIDPATGGQITNYTLGTGTITAVTIVSGLPPANAPGVEGYNPPSGRSFDGMLVKLTATGVPTGAANTLTVRNVRDRGTPGSAIATATIPFTDSGYKWVETGLLGTSAYPGHVVPIGTNGFDIYSSGTTQWANYDEVTFAYKAVTGDFDYAARLEFQDVSSVWARAGIMLREDLDVGEPNPPDTEPGTFGRYVSMHANPVTSFNEAGPTPVFRNGNNSFESHVRTGATLQGTANGTDSGGGGTPIYPNAWLRIVRAGDVVTTYRGVDGDTWTESAVRTFTTPLPATMYLGPSFSPETGNIQPPEGKNRLFLAAVRFNKVATPLLRSFAGSASGFRYLVDDAVVNQLDTNTVVLSFNGTTVTPIITKEGSTTTISYAPSAALPSGSTNTTTLTFRDNGSPVNTVTYTRSFTVSQYTPIPASWATTSVDLTKPGFSVYVHQLPALPFRRFPGDENSIANAETELANGYIDPATGQPYPNQAVPGTNGFIFIDSDTINWDIDGNDAGPGENFRASNGYPNESVPGIDVTVNSDNFAVEITTYLQLAAGAYQMGVNSDDGFRVSVAPGEGDVFGRTLGQFSGGRGSSDTLFDVVVATNGVYPFRLTWWQGGGNGDLEWFLVNAAGQKILLNDTNSAVRAYSEGAGRVRVESVLPADGATGVPTTNNIIAVLVDDLTSVVNGSILMTVNGGAVTPTVTKTGTTNLVVYNPPNDFSPGTPVTVTLTYTENTTPATNRTVQWSFTPTYFGPNAFAIEAEHFNYDAGQHVLAVSTMPYTGGEYAGFGASHDIDYHANDVGPFNANGPDAHNYRTGIAAERTGPSRYVPMDSQTTAGTLDVQRPGFDVTVNHKIGWTAGGEWYNYTRVIPSGTYIAVAALSHGDAAATMRASLQLVTAGAGTSNQTIQPLGTFTAPATGGWGNNALVPLKGPDGSNVVMKLSGTNTIRFTTDSGDYDWFMLVPVTGYAPRILSVSPANGGLTKQNSELNFVISDLSTAVVPSSIQLYLNGVLVTNGLTITDTADGATVRYVPPGGFVRETTNTYQLVYSDNGSPSVTQTNTGTFRVSPVGPGNFIIEAEDFNYAAGQHMPAASVMPYLGGAYTNLSAVHLVDYMSNDGNDSDVYRRGEIPNKNINENGDNDRGTFTVTYNYKLGWTDVGDWMNYTRNFPTNNYEVFAALSHGETGATAIRGSLHQITGDTATTNQTVTSLGVFRAPGTGGWGSNTHVPLTDTNGNRIVLSLGGIQTLRFWADSGDFDYLTLVPSNVPQPPRITSITRNSNGTVTVTWTGGGSLVASSNIMTPSSTWPVVATSSPYTTTPTGTQMYFRVKR